MAVGSFSAALSGLDAETTYLGVIGNNLANINTVGFKDGVVSFADLVSQSIGSTSANPTQVGLGVATESISPNFSQGAIDTTTTPTDVALQGAGFFVVSGSNGVAYTRAGDFSLNANGTLVTPEGQQVLGYTTLNAQGQVIASGQPTAIVIPPGVLQTPVATTTFETATNLNAASTVGSTFTSSVQIYDSLGNAHTASIQYTNTGAGAWSYSITVPGADATGGTAGTPFSVASGSLTFGTNGALETVNGASPANVAITTPTWTDGAAASSLTWDLVGSNSVGTLTGYASDSATSAVDQNGTAPGQLTNLSIAPDGTISATVGAGQSVNIAQLAIANFNNPDGLVSEGSNLYAAGQAAGSANVGVAGTGGRGSVVGGALEESNVDIAQEFTNMIIAQRGYEANAKSITVSDDLLQDTLNIIQE